MSGGHCLCSGRVPGLIAGLSAARGRVGGMTPDRILGPGLGPNSITFLDERAAARASNYREQ
jgi:hypothetical protein